MSEDRPEFISEVHPPIEFMVLAYKDWLTSLQHRVTAGSLTNDQMVSIISRSFVLKDLKAAKAIKESIQDGLTQVYNRRVFSSELSAKVGFAKSFGLLILDLDYFKKINDTHGHPAGDEVLFQTAQRLAANVRQVRSQLVGQDSTTQMDVIARYGGEEFGIILDGVSNPEVMNRIAENLRHEVGEYPFVVTDNSGKVLEIRATASIGATVSKPGDSAEIITKRADGALYKAKQEGRNRVIIT